MTAKEILRLLQQNGWYICETKGSHYQLKHDEKSGKITIPFHKGDLKAGTLNSILKQAGLKEILN
ncbi:type II toxin-antitoxin system HicA family toxin [Treponema sp. OMZ 792]|uniref:type II toxin-antitoxin system HicA family toxin n=2 Tax=unclassified Treponema TaxID=2638727 RepID=UPI0020A5F54F|nr:MULTISPECIES: type II toxin-antitoxin system HicA family toxin [unclassified Treponema]UTC75863.1 type II toxin-antitoxin system HicA family toxin [Treponema sp. OMZ 792]UTC78330.1 addiction module toxin, HicA family [Treponema sp. OMZ 799]UTC79864.1 addiction module toxin, HicA family [Treponema sp. OMZ 798]